MSGVFMQPVSAKDFVRMVNARSVRAKYGNKKTQIDGLVFDSKREAKRYSELKRMQDCGLIEDLRCQVTFEVIPKCGNERAAKYVADFTYMQDGKMVTEDAKGTRTRDYVLKRKLMRWVHGIEVVEV